MSKSPGASLEVHTVITASSEKFLADLRFQKDWVGCT
jgi:hypothetical protein